jgi:hypothetical protein
VSVITGRERELDQSFHQVQRGLPTFRDHQKEIHDEMRLLMKITSIGWLADYVSSSKNFIR